MPADVAANQWHQHYLDVESTWLVNFPNLKAHYRLDAASEQFVMT